MLRPTPKPLLGDMMVLKVCTGVDDWENPTFKEIRVSNVHLQNIRSLTKSKDNTEILLTSTVFIDTKYSKPNLDYESLQMLSEQNGSQMRTVVYNSKGKALGDYAVVTVDPVPDYPDNKIHHIELGLI